MKPALLVAAFPFLVSCAHARPAAVAAAPVVNSHGPRPDWVDGTSAQYPRDGYLLGIGMALAALPERINDLDNQAVQWKSQLDSGTEKLARVKAAMRLLALFKARAPLIADLRIIDLTGKGLASPVDEAAVRPQAAKALA